MSGGGAEGAVVGRFADLGGTEMPPGSQPRWEHFVQTRALGCLRYHRCRRCQRCHRCPSARFMSGQTSVGALRWQDGSTLCRCSSAPMWTTCSIPAAGLGCVWPEGSDEPPGNEQWVRTRASGQNLSVGMAFQRSDVDQVLYSCPSAASDRSTQSKREHWDALTRGCGSQSCQLVTPTSGAVMRCPPPRSVPRATRSSQDLPTRTGQGPPAHSPGGCGPRRRQDA